MVLRSVPIRSDQLNPIFPIHLFMVKIVFYWSKGNIIIFHKEQFVAKIDIQAEKTTTIGNNISTNLMTESDNFTIMTLGNLFT